MVSVIERCMMKVLPWFALLFACTAVPADAHLAFAGTPKTDLFSSARLIDTNQSQSLEAVSTADGNLRLPSCKLAGVYFITGNNGQTFDNEDVSFGFLLNSHILSLNMNSNGGIVKER